MSTTGGRPGKTILCIGAGHVGGPTMAVIAARCPEHRVVVTDRDAERIRSWQSGEPPIYEPGLREVLRAGLGRNLFFTDDIDGSIDRAEIIFVSVNTPTKTFGLGAGLAADLQHWERTARRIVAASRSGKVVVEKSTLPVRTAEAMERILNAGAAETGIRFEVVSNPEFLAEGRAIRDLEGPDRVLVGGHDTPSGRRAVEAIVEIYEHWVPREKIVTTSVWSSELSKLAANAFLAQRVSSINAISALCEATGADVLDVGRAVGLDSRIGPRFLEAGIGFGGSCFRKDILNLVYLAQSLGLAEVAEYWRQVVALNEHQKERFVRRIVDAMFGTVVGKRIAVLGAAFKADTGDTRDSPALLVCRRLVEERAEVVVTDPQAMANARQDLADLGASVQFEEDPYRAAAGAHALAVLTSWSEFRGLDYRRIHRDMAKPAFVFDGRNWLDDRALFEIGFNVYPIGRPARTHF